MWGDGATRTVMGVIPPVLRRQGVQDVLIGIGFYLSVMPITIRIDNASGSVPSNHFDAGTAFLILGASVALAFRHRLPRLHLYAILALTVLYILRDYTGGPFFLAVFIAVATVASILPSREALRHAAVVFVVLAISGFVVDSEETQGWAHLLYLSWSVVAFLGGKTVRDRRELLEGLRERNRQLEETQEEEALRRVAEERVRIARDLHDIVAHNIAGISLQAATGAHVADAHPDQAREALLAIKDASRQTLDELRTTLHLLRQGDEDAPLAPTPGLDALDDLVEAVNANGVPTTLEVMGDAASVPDAVAGAAYRIIQESLTNVMRHAGPAKAAVLVDRVGDGLNVRIEDDGRGASTAVDAEPHGHGISGMRERALALGGTVEAGPRPGGGYRVRAWLPVDPGAAVVDEAEPEDERGEPVDRPGPPWRHEGGWHGSSRGPWHEVTW
jgi:signal transduction histidine kinase